MKNEDDQRWSLADSDWSVADECLAPTELQCCTVHGVLAACVQCTQGAHWHNSAAVLHCAQCPHCLPGSVHNVFKLQCVRCAHWHNSIAVCAQCLATIQHSLVCCNMWNMQCSICSIAVLQCANIQCGFCALCTVARCNIMQCSVWSARTVIAGQKNCARCNVQYTVKYTYEMRSVHLCRFQCKVCVG